MEHYRREIETLIGERVLLTVTDSKGKTPSTQHTVLIEDAYSHFFLTTREAVGGTIRECFTYADLHVGHVRLQRAA